jgi:DNA repair protein RecN (Recombination protein N)
MLSRLLIQNYAIIDRLEIEFSKGLNIITGETGAGKSIIAGALGLILGDRADSSVLSDAARKCIVEGAFKAETKKEVRQFLSDNELDDHDELVIRREVSSTGKSRAFINDTPVTLVQLHKLGALLVDLHRQFDTLELGEIHFQREVLDALAGQTGRVDAYHEVFRQWQEKKSELENMIRQKTQLDKEADYNHFQFQELQQAAFRENELEESEAELKILSHSEGIKNVLSKIFYDLKESETPLLQQLKIMLNQLQAYAGYHTGLDELIKRLQSAQVELQDIAGEAGRLGHRISYDTEKTEKLNERLSLGYRLLKKHGVKTTNELLQIQKQLDEKLQMVVNMDETIRQKENECKSLWEQAVQMAEKISKERQKQAKPFEKKVNQLLAQVGMPEAEVRVEVNRRGNSEKNMDVDLGPYGTDEVEFLFDANRSKQFLSLRKVASGGELNRLMLCIKSLVAQSMDLPTLVFDEIDSGISGEAARRIGIIIKELAANRQVIAITHQPQIAGRADAHFFVYKQMIKGSAQTGIRQLSVEERIIAIAQMLSGEKPSAAAIENAREMVMG